MIILAIDTSCDDTSIALLKRDKLKTEILSNVVSSQIKLHQKYGGVYPSLAKREHRKNAIPVLKNVLKKANLLIKKEKIKSDNFSADSKKFQTLEGIFSREEGFLKIIKVFLTKYKKPKIGAIAITIGPGLDPCLWIGINFAKALSFYWNVPLIPINHIEAHILANWLPPTGKNSKQIKFPAICLVASGGHTQLILMEKIGSYKIIGETRDDAAGECFDKTARMLGLPYPGGPPIAAEATKFPDTNNKLKIHLPRPMLNSKNYDFSFSGLKTAVLYDFKKRQKKIRTSINYIITMAKEIQQAIIDVLVKKTLKAAEDYKAKSVILGGGVGANTELRKQLGDKLKNTNRLLSFFVPPKKFCADNAAMIGMAAYFNKKNTAKNWKKIKADANLRI